MKTKSLTFRTEKTINGESINVNIRLNDECKNGHQDFSITADIYKAGKPKTDRYHISGGCCHDEILKAFPEFKIFVDLHLCDYLGNPMHAVANGFYHLKNGFNRTTINSELFKGEYCEYYRVTPEQFDVLNASHSQTHFAINLVELGITKQWEIQAKEGIKLLEGLTGDEFVIDSVRTQLTPPSDEQIRAEKDLLANGYYSNESIAERTALAKQAFIQNMKNNANEQISKINKDLNIRIALFELGDKRVLENTIYYGHSKELGFNWRSDQVIEPNEALEIFNKIKAQFPAEIEAYTLKS